MRLCSFIAAMMHEGPDTTRRIPATASGICHQESCKKPVTSEAMAVPMTPTARPIAAKTPAKRAASKACCGGVGDGGVGAGGPTSAASARVTDCTSGVVGVTARAAATALLDAATAVSSR